MRVEVSSLDRNQITKFAAIILIALASALALLWATHRWTTHALETKWFVAVVVSLFFPWVLLLFRNVEFFFLTLFVFLLPIDPDYHFSSIEFAAGANGLTLSACDVILAILLLMWIARLTVTPPQERHISILPSVSLPFGLLILWSSLSILKATDPKASGCELIDLMKGWFVFFYLANNVKTDRQLKAIVFALSGAVLIQSGIAFAQYFLGTSLNLHILGENTHSLLSQETGTSQLVRVGGTLGHPNGLAFFLVTALPVILSFGLAENFGWMTLITSSTFVFGLMALVLSFCRVGWISAAIVLPMILFLVGKKRWGLFPTFMILGCFGLLAVLALLPFSASIAQRLFEEDYGRAWSRIPLIQVAWNIICSHPFLGIGLNNYMFVMSQYDNTLERITYQVAKPVHNMFLLMAAEIGIPGLLIFIGLAGILLHGGWRYFRQGKDLRNFFSLGCVGALISALLHGQANFTYVGSNPFLKLFIGLLGASICWYERTDTNR